MTFAAAIRPDDWDLPLFLHVFGAMLLVGTLVTAAWFLFAARRDNSLDGVRWGWRTLLFAALPSYILMRVGAEWIADKENLGDSEAAWIGIGFITSDAGAPFCVTRAPGETGTDCTVPSRSRMTSS